MASLPALPRVLRIFPSRAAAERAVQESRQQAQDTTGFVTFRQLFRELGAAQGRRFASTWLVRLALQDLMAKTKPWSKMAQDPWSVRAVGKALMELRRAGGTARGLQGDETSPALKDLARLLKVYEYLLEERRWFDEADQEREAVLAAIGGKLPPAYQSLELVVVEQESNLFGARLDLLSGFVARGMSVQVKVPWDPQRPQAFAWSTASIHRIEGLGRDHLQVEHDDLVGTGELSPLRKAQFSSAHAPNAPVRLLHIPDVAEHARQVALWVRDALRGGVAPNEIAVAVTDDGAMVTRIVEAMQSAGIATYRRGGVPLSQYAGARALVRMLEMNDGPPSREDVLRIWESLERSIPTDAGVVNVASVVRWVRQSGVRAIDEDLAATLTRAQSRRYFGKVPQRQQQAIQRVTSELLQLAKDIRELPAQASFAEWCEALNALWARWGQQPALNMPPLELFDAPLAQSAGLHHLMQEEMQEFLQELSHTAVAGGVVQEWPRLQFAATLRLWLSEWPVEADQLRAGAVLVGSPENIVGSRVRCLAVVGVDSGAFPRAVGTDPILSDALRAEINHCLGGPRLLVYGTVGERDRLHASARDNILWLQLLLACEENLLVTTGVSSGEEARSDFVEELLRSVQRSEVETPVLHYAATQPAHVAQLRNATAFHCFGMDTRISRTMPRVDKAALWDAVSQQRWTWSQELRRRVEAEERLQAGLQEWPVLNGHTREALERYYFHRVLSASALDELAKCRYRHFAGSILKLEREYPEKIGADAREEGSIAHAALHLVYDALAQCGGLSWAQANGEAAWQRAREVFDAGAAQIMAEANVHPLLHESTLALAWVFVRAQLERDLKRAEPLEPVAFEFPFGDRGGDQAPPLQIQDANSDRTLRVRGSIDRVDVGGGSLVTIDYKRRKLKRSDRHFQLPVYAAVALQRFGKGVLQHHAQWSYLHDNRVETAPGLEAKPHEFLQQFGTRIFERVDAVLAGDITPDPEPTHFCRRCDFSTLCRYVPTDDADEDA